MIDEVHVFFYRRLSRASSEPARPTQDAAAKFREHIVCLIRSICAVLLAFVLLSSNGAFAGDFSLTYAIDANGKTDVGKIKTCEYFKPCEIESVDRRLSISLRVTRLDHSSAELEVMGRPVAVIPSMRLKESI